MWILIIIIIIIISITNYCGSIIKLTSLCRYSLLECDFQWQVRTEKRNRFIVVVIIIIIVIVI